ncbi:MAG: glycosyltransferase family 9 protein [Ignavibacteriae bacterium]|nr:glycosyltransferase family 9 protein [Ignavibacteriota bacterium]
MLLRRYTGEVVEGNPFVDELLWYDRDHTRIPFVEMVRVLRERAFDAAIVVYPRFRLAWLMFLAGIPIRIGTGYRWYSVLFNRKTFEHRKDAKRHEVEYNLNLLNELQCGLTENFAPQFDIQIPSAAEASAQAILRQKGIVDSAFAVLHPGSGGSAREWSPENFGTLALRLMDEAGMKVLVTGAAGEEEKVSRVVQASEGRAIPTVGELSIKEFGAVLRSAKLYVSNSTGPLHLAVAMGTPVLGLYPQHVAMSARRWGPYTKNAAVLVPQRPLDCNVCVETQSPCECMATISVDHVFQSAMSVVNKIKQENVGHAN